MKSIDLPGWYLAEAGGDRIRVDNDAGGNGWFVYGAPEENAQDLRRRAPRRAGTRPRRACPGWTPASTCSRRWSVIMGHMLGLDDTDDPADRDDVMFGYLSTGERRVPAKGQASAAVKHKAETRE